MQTHLPQHLEHDVPRAGGKRWEAPSEPSAAEALLHQLRLLHGNVRGAEIFREILAEARRAAQ